MASLKPNDFGLFDMQGNASEWVYDPPGGYPSGSEEAAADVSNTNAVSDSSRRILRGGANSYQKSLIRSADRLNHQPDSRYFIYGFRPSRTYNLSP